MIVVLMMGMSVGLSLLLKPYSVLPVVLGVCGTLAAVGLLVLAFTIGGFGYLYLSMVVGVFGFSSLTVGTLNAAATRGLLGLKPQNGARDRRY